MKRMIAFLLMLASFGASAQLTVNQLRLDQRNPANTAYVSRFIGNLYTPTPCFFILSGPIQPDGIQPPICPRLGPNFAINSGQVDIVGVVGTPGAQGIQGIQGVAGQDGAQGVQGIQGPPGDVGPQGVTGAIGPAGVQGEAGPTGAAGVQGVAGPAGSTGATGPQGIQGIQGPAGANGAAAPAFDFSAPAVRTIAVATAYQASNTAKAAIVTISPACTNTTTLLAASACTMQVRQSSSAGLTCSNGAVSMTWTSTVNLGLVITTGSGSPFDVKLPIGGYFILCATAGTFTIGAVDQTAG